MSTEQSVRPATIPPRRFLVCMTCDGWGHVVTVTADGWRTTGVCPVCLGDGERTSTCRLCETYGHHHESPCVQSQAA